MKTKLQITLQTIAPSVSIETHWSIDPDCRDIREECGGYEDENPEDWTAWQSEVRATAIDQGDEKTGSDYLGGTWEKASDLPWRSNPEISGYEPQMTEAALLELRGLVSSPALVAEIDAAIAHVKATARAEYEAQRQNQPC